MQNRSVQIRSIFVSIRVSNTISDTMAFCFVNTFPPLFQYLPRGIPLNTAFTSVPQSAPFKPKPLPSLPAPIPLPTLPVNRPVNTHPTVLQTFPKPKANFKLIVGLNCLECLCQASSNCNHVGCCNNKGCEGAYCGPYLLSWGYWADGGQPGNGANYLSCANNRTCAELAVQGYMNKWNKVGKKSIQTLFYRGSPKKTLKKNVL